MQNTSSITNWATIKQRGTYAVEVMAEINGVQYPGYTGTSGIWELRKTAPALSKPEIGKCMSGQLNLTLVLPPSASIPRMAQIDVYVRLADDLAVSGYLPQGTFYVDTRRAEGDFLFLTAYDAMLKAERSYAESGDVTGWPKTDAACVAEICTMLGLTLDSRTTLNKGYTVEFPGYGDGAYTVREVLGYIGAMYVGNWIITDAGQLRLIPFVPSGVSVLTIDETNGNAKSLTVGALQNAYTGVTVIVGTNDDGEQVVYTAGNDTGRVLEITCPWGTQNIATDILTTISGYTYLPYHAEAAVLDPAAELGDKVTIDGQTAMIAELSTNFLQLYTADISAPEDTDIDHEYPYKSSQERTINRKIAQSTASLRVDMNAIEGRVTDVEDDVASMVLITPEMIELTVVETSTQGGTTYATISLTVNGEERGRGQITLDGNVNVSGTLSAEELYAALGDIAELTVSRLSTSRRIALYLADDDSDDNYIDVEHEEYKWVTGKVKLDSSTDLPLTEQAKNPAGALLYWDYLVATAGSDDIRDVSGVTINSATGYPQKDGARIFTTTSTTPYPVYVYQYEDDIKAKLAFEMDTDGSEYYEPVIVLGSGDELGRSKGYIKKETDGLKISYQTKRHGKSMIHFGDDGFVDIYGLRRTVALDCSGFPTAGHTGTISETLEGIETPIEYGVAVNAAGTEVTLTYPDNETLVVTLPT